MARQINRLNARKVQTLATPGRHGDGGGLYLVVDKRRGKRWVFIYRSRSTGRLREMGLGGVISVSLATARGRALEARNLLAVGRDPIDARKTSFVGMPTFGDFADQVVTVLEKGWRSAKHRAQWRMTLERYAAPLRSKLVNQITTEDVLAVLQPIWTSKAETAFRLRGRIEKVLDAAKAKELLEDHFREHARVVNHFRDCRRPGGYTARDWCVQTDLVDVFIALGRSKMGLEVGYQRHSERCSSSRCIPR